MVVICHLDPFVGALAPPRGRAAALELFRRLDNGNFAVCVFFVMSGYALIAVYARSKEKSYLATGAIKRYFRLTPVVLVSMIGAFLLGISIGFHNHLAAQELGGNAWLSGAYTGSGSLFEAAVQGLFTVYLGDVNYNPALWTMSVEFWGSLFLFCFAAAFYDRRQFPLISAFAALLLMATLHVNGVYFALFLYGAALLRFRPNRSLWYLIVPAAYLAMENPAEALTHWLAAILLSRHLSLGAPVAVFFHAIAAALLITAVIGSRRLRSALSAAPLVRLGEISFPLYVCHMPIMMSVGTLTFTMFVAHGHDVTGAAVAMAVSLAVSIAVASLLTRAVDQPAQRIAAKIGRTLIAAIVPILPPAASCSKHPTPQSYKPQPASDN